MNDEDDIDSLFLCYFTILNPPLRLSLLTAGCLSAKLAQIIGQKEEIVDKMLRENPEMYSALIQQNQETILTSAIERSKFVLNSPKNSQEASGILASMIKNGYYIQKTRYHFPNAPTKKQEQQVPVANLIPAFKTMNEICKRWNDPTLKEGLQ